MLTFLMSEFKQWLISADDSSQGLFLHILDVLDCSVWYAIAVHIYWCLATHFELHLNPEFKVCVMFGMYKHIFITSYPHFNQLQSAYTPLHSTDYYRVCDHHKWFLTQSLTDSTLHRLLSGLWPPQVISNPVSHRLHRLLSGLWPPQMVSNPASHRLQRLLSGLWPPQVISNPVSHRLHTPQTVIGSVTTTSDF